MTASSAQHPVRYFLSGVLIVIAAATVTYGLSVAGVLERWENNNLDRWLLARAPEQSNAIVLVVIDDVDYEQLFGSRSPLNEAVVLDIVRTIARATPTVIGVDLDTSDWIDGASNGLAQVGVPTVWARGARPDETDHRLAKVFGRDNPVGVCAGVPAMYVDDDGIVRRAYASWRTAHGTVPSFSTLVAQRHRGLPCEVPPAPAGGPHASDESHGETRVNFLQRGYAFKRFTVRAVRALATTDGWLNDPDFHGKAVLLGGIYHAARDRYPTPVGLMDGVELAAQVTQNQIVGRPVLVVGHVAHFVMDVAIGCVLLLVLLAFRSPVWKLVVLSVTAVCVCVVSLVLFQTTAYFFSFVPVLAGLCIHETIELFLDRRHLQRENAALKQQLGLVEPGRR